VLHRLAEGKTDLLVLEGRLVCAVHCAGNAETLSEEVTASDLADSPANEPGAVKARVAILIWRPG
jgi:hypothetical protein